MSAEEFGYTQCSICHMEVLTFALVDGVCDRCVDKEMRETDGRS